MRKSTKSQQGERYPLFENSSRVHELVVRSSAWQVRAIKDKVKVGGFALPAISYYHACEHITRRSRADSCTHCLHARIIGVAGVGLIPALTEVTISLLQWGIDRFAQANAVGVAETGAEGGARSVTDEVLLYFVLPK